MISTWWNIEVAPWQRVAHYSVILGCHISVGYLMWMGHWSLLGLSLILAYGLSQIGISLAYHRLFTHNAAPVPRWLEIALTLYGGLALQGSSLGWVATHNAHHKHQGTSKDPHSPKQSHWLAIQMVGYSFRNVSGRHAGRLLRDKWHIWFHTHYWKIYGPIFFLPFLIFPFEWVLATLWAPVALTWQLQSLANTWGHAWGKGDADEAIDDVRMYPFVLGDCFHKSHHDKPGRLRFHKYDAVGWLGERLFLRHLPQKRLF